MPTDPSPASIEKAFEACRLIATAREINPEDDFEFAADADAAIIAAREALKLRDAAT